MTGVDVVAQALVQAAVDVTAAAAGWLLEVDGEYLRVVAAVGGEPGKLLGATVPVGQGTAGYVAASGQPLAMGNRSDAVRFGEGVAALAGREPASVLCVPCTAGDEVVGALELIDKPAGATFSFDDVELATVLAGIAGVALRAGTSVAPSTPSPGQLAGDLERLANADPARYAAVALMISALMS